MYAVIIESQTACNRRFDLSNRKEINYHSRKEHTEIAKCLVVRKIEPRKTGKLCIFLYNGRKYETNLVTYIRPFHFAQFFWLYFPYLRTFRSQTWQFYKIYHPLFRNSPFVAEIKKLFYHAKGSLSLPAGCIVFDLLT